MAYYLIFGITFGFAAAVQPGPLQTFLISRSLTDGWRRTLPAAFAPLVSDIAILLLVLLFLVNIPIWAQNLLRFAGGFFLLFLAWNAFQAFRKYSFNPSAVLQSQRENFLKAVVVNLLNPNPYLSWSLVMGPLLIKGWQQAPSHGIALVGSFYAAMIGVSAAIILVFAAVAGLGPRISRTLIGISAVALAGFGIYQLWLGLTTIF